MEVVGSNGMIGYLDNELSESPDYRWKSNLSLGQSGVVTREDLVHVVKFYWIEVGCIVSRSSLLGRLDMTAAWSCK